MTQEAHVGDGWPLSLQYRALATAAALARLGYTIERATHAAHALRLLCRRDQLALLGASSASTDPAARSQVAPASHGPPVKFRRLQAVGHALPFDGHLVCLDGVPTAEQALNAGVACAFGFVGVPPALPPLPGIVPLPIPVAAQALQPAQNQRRRGIAFVVVHPRRCAKARQAAMDGLGKGAVTTFDPYCADDAPHERVVGPCGPADRIALWRRSEAVLLSTQGGCDEDSFAREARAAGTPVFSVAQWLALSAKEKQSASGAANRAASTSEQALAVADAAMAVGTAASFDAVAAIIAQRARTQPNEAIGPWTHQAEDVRCILADSADVLAQVAGEAQPGERAALLVCLGERHDEEALQLLAGRMGYEVVIVVLSDHPLLASRVLQAALSARLSRGELAPVDTVGAKTVEAAVGSARRWLAGGGLRVLHALVGADGSLPAQRVWNTLCSAPVQGRVLVHSSLPSPMLLNEHRIGAAVASNDLGRGMRIAAVPRCRLQWIDMAPGSPGGRRTILPTTSDLFARPPQLAGVAADANEQASYDEVIHAFAQGEVDAYFNPSGPRCSHLIAARNAYARWPVPVVGVLHSVHGGLTAAELEHRMLTVDAGPFDALISPSHCGRQAILHQWQELLEFHQTRLVHVPTLEVDVIAYGVDTAAYLGRERAACRWAQGLDPHALIFCSVGRFSLREKGDLLPLLLAFKEVAASHPRAQLVLAGAPVHDSDVARLRTAANALGIAERVHIRLSIDADDKAQLLCAADAFVSVSDNVQETYGLALCEAMAAGTPVIAPAWNGFKEIVASGETGVLVPARWCHIDPARLAVQQWAEGYMGNGWADLHETVAIDIPALVAAMRAMADHPPWRQQMGERAQRRAAADFDVVRQSHKVLERLLERAHEAKTSGVPCPQRWRRENVAQSFAHYASDMVDAHSRVQAGAAGRDAKAREAVFAALHLESRSEQSAIERAIDKASLGAVPLSELVSKALPLPRLLRCLKYGLLQLAQPPPTFPTPD